MYPAFFPLSGIGECAKGVPQRAYDVKDDGLLNRMQSVMDRFEYKPQ